MTSLEGRGQRVYARHRGLQDAPGSCREGPGFAVLALWLLRFVVSLTLDPQ
jgi:hypothetical protein